MPQYTDDALKEFAAGIADEIKDKKNVKEIILNHNNYKNKTNSEKCSLLLSLFILVKNRLASVNALKEIMKDLSEEIAREEVLVTIHILQSGQETSLLWAQNHLITQHHRGGKKYIPFADTESEKRIKLIEKNIKSQEYLNLMHLLFKVLRYSPERKIPLNLELSTLQFFIQESLKSKLTLNDKFDSLECLFDLSKNALENKTNKNPISKSTFRLLVKALKEVSLNLVKQAAEEKLKVNEQGDLLKPEAFDDFMRRVNTSQLIKCHRRSGSLGRTYTEKQIIRYQAKSYSDRNKTATQIEMQKLGIDLSKLNYQDSGTLSEQMILACMHYYLKKKIFYHEFCDYLNAVYKKTIDARNYQLISHKQKNAIIFALKNLHINISYLELDAQKAKNKVLNTVFYREMNEELIDYHRAHFGRFSPRHTRTHKTLRKIVPAFCQVSETQAEKDKKEALVNKLAVIYGEDKPGTISYVNKKMQTLAQAQNLQIDWNKCKSLSKKDLMQRFYDPNKEHDDSFDRIMVIFQNVLDAYSTKIIDDKLQDKALRALKAIAVNIFKEAKTHNNPELKDKIKNSELVKKHRQSGFKSFFRRPTSSSEKIEQLEKANTSTMTSDGVELFEIEPKLSR